MTRRIVLALLGLVLVSVLPVTAFVLASLPTTHATAAEPVRPSAVLHDTPEWEVWEFRLPPSNPLAATHRTCWVVRPKDGGLREPRVPIPLGC